MSCILKLKLKSGRLPLNPTLLNPKPSILGLRGAQEGVGE